LNQKTEEVMRNWRKLHDEELRNVYSSPKYNLNDEIEEDKIGEACSTNMGEDERVYIIGGKPEGKNH
jgi:hypothetical protein